MKMYYTYDRPLDGQPEERWWLSLAPRRRDALLEQQRADMAARQSRWNATHPAERQIPRPL